MTLWIDDVRQPPNDSDYIWTKSVDEAISEIKNIELYFAVESGKWLDGSVLRKVV